MGVGKVRDPVKVVIINTQYVETDANSFKSVVQRLTGKDSTAEEVGGRFQSSVNIGGGAAAVARGMSFKDLDRMLKELPSLDELYSLFPEQ